MSRWKQLVLHFGAQNAYQSFVTKEILNVLI